MVSQGMLLCSCINIVLFSMYKLSDYIMFSSGDVLYTGTCVCWWCVQALVEMSDLSTAQQMVDYYKNMPARIRSQPIHVQFSMHERLKVSHYFHH